MTSKRPGEADEPVRAARSGWATLPELHAGRLGLSAHRRLEPGMVPAGQIAQRFREHSQPLPRGLIQQLRGVRIQCDRSWSNIESSASGEIDQRRGAWFEPGHSRLEPRPPASVDAQPLGLEARRDQRDELGIVDLAQIVGVQAGQPGHVEAGGAAADRVQVEPLDRLRGRDDLVVAMAPAQAQQVIAHRLRQKAHFPVRLDRERAVPLGQLGAVGAVDQRDMREDRRVPVERAVQLRLACGVHQVIVAADDVGDRHVVVVHDHREHVGGRAVGAQQDHVVQLRVGEAHLALDPILDHRFAAARRFEPDHRRHARRRLGRIAIAPAAVVDGAPSLGTRAAPASPRAPPACSSKDRPRRAPGVPAPPRRGAPAALTGTRAARRRSGQASPGHRRLPGSPLRSNGRGRCPRSAAGTCRRGVWRTAS